MTDRGVDSLSSIRADELPMLVAFLRGYLHQDLAEAHGTALAAFEAFWADADTLERRRFLKDWEVLTRAAGRARWSEVRVALGELGASWTPPTKRAFTNLDRAVAAKRGHQGRSVRS